jgi:hypothetical protein
VDDASEYVGSSYLAGFRVLVDNRTWRIGLRARWAMCCRRVNQRWQMASCCDRASVIATVMMLTMLMMMWSGGGEVQYRRDRGMCAQTMR